MFFVGGGGVSGGGDGDSGGGRWGRWRWCLVFYVGGCGVVVW